MQELRDAGVMLRLIYEAMKKKGIDTDAIFTRLGVDENYVYTEQLRTPTVPRCISGRLLRMFPGIPMLACTLGNYSLRTKDRCWNISF